MKKLKIVIGSLIGPFIYWVAFAENVFAFQILAWIILILSLIGLCFKDVIKEVYDTLDSFTSVVSWIAACGSLWIFFTNGAETFGYFYILNILIVQCLLIGHRINKN